jgi:hypothetical protein
MALEEARDLARDRPSTSACATSSSGRLEGLDSLEG